MPISAIVDQPPASHDNRKDVRWRIRLELPGSLDGSANVTIHDLSAAGMLVETNSQLEVGQSITVCLPNADDVTAQVVWRDERLFGCRFDEPLPAAAVSAAKLRSPAVAPTAMQQEALAERLLRLRRTSGFSRAALSVRTGFSKPSIWAWESGRTVPRRANLLVLAEVFGLTEQQLLLGDQAAAAEKALERKADHQPNALRDAIEEARHKISSIADVPPSQVHISIDF